MNTYNWKINALDCHTNQDGLENVVYTIHWSYMAKDENENIANMIGTHSVDAPSSESFTAFADLTQEIVEGWLVAGIGEERIAQMQENLDAQIQEKVAPTKVTLQLPTVE
jgi:hypothetical protein